MIIDFYTETFSTLVENVTNNVYFQAWATKSRADVFEFSQAQLKAIMKDKSEKVLIKSVSTEHRGKG